MDASPPCTRLPALAAPPRALTPDEEREFAFFGCVLLEDVISPAERAPLSAMADEVFAMRGDDVSLAFERGEGGAPRLCRVEGFVPRHAGFAELAAERLAPLAARLLGAREAFLFKEKLNIKRARGGGGYAAHFDGPSAAAAGLARRFVTAQVAVDDQTVANGCLQAVMPRSACPWFDDAEGADEGAAAARVMVAPTDGDPDAGGRVGAIDPALAAGLPWQALPCRAGSVLLFHGLFPHRSPANASAADRRTAYFIFNAADDGGDCHEAYKLVMAAQRAAASEARRAAERAAAEAAL